MRFTTRLSRSKLTLAALALIFGAGVGWLYSWRTFVREDDLSARPDVRLEIPVRLVAGEEVSREFVPHVDLPHRVHLEIRPDPLEDIPDPLLDVTWSVTLEDSIVAEAGHRGRVDMSDRPIAWLGEFDADEGERYVVRVSVGRTVPQLEGAAARLVVVPDHLHLKDAYLTALLVSRVAFFPCALGLALLLVTVLNRRRDAERRRRPGHSL